MVSEDRIAEAPVRVAQLTDTHLFASADARFDGVNTFDSLRATIAALEASGHRRDLVVVTGDLVHEAVPAAYRRLQALLSGINAPVCCLAGNHDEPELMVEILRGQNIYMPRTSILGAWRFVFLNTRVPGSDGGHLEAAELVDLENALREEPSRHVAVFLHHPPLAIGSPWMDAMGIDNGDALLRLAERHERLRCIAWGHIHQEFEARRGRAILLGTPSTCVQFAPGSSQYRKDPAAPGFRWFEFFPDGRVATGVNRIPDAG